MPPQEAPTTIWPEGNSRPSPPAPPRQGPTPRNREKEASGSGGRRAHCAGKTDPGVQVSVSLQKKGEGGYPWCLGKEWNPEAILGCEEATAMAPEAAPRGTPQPHATALAPWNPEHRAAAEDGSRGFVLTLPSKLFSSISLMSARRSPELSKRQVSAWGPMA